MKELVEFQNVQTMTSLELVDLINSVRIEEGRKQIRHNDFMAKVLKVLGEEAARNFSHSYIGKDGTTRPCYALPKREANLMVMSESYKVQAAVYDKMVELEGKAQYSKVLSPAEALLQSVQLMVDIEHRQKETESNVIKLQEKVKELEYKTHTSPNEFYTISGYASLRGIKVDVSKAGALGKQATRLSKEWDYPINKAHSEIFGQLNVYHIDVLNAVFETL